MGKAKQRFFGTTAPGLEPVAEEEIREKLPGVTVEKCMRGKVFFSGTVQKEELLLLTCVDNLYFYVAEVEIGPHKKDLEQFFRRIKRISFHAAEEYLGLYGKVRVLVSASKKGKQTYSRFDVADAATKALTEGKRYQSGTVEMHDLAVRLDVEGKRCTVAAQITSADFRFRGETYEFMPGGIRPTVAAALVRLSKPQADEVFYDPFCGSGSIAKERARYGARRILASDLNPEAVEAAKKNVPESVRVFCCDATRMKAADGSVDVIVSNIPWGRQIAVKDIPGLYTALLKEADRVLKKDGRMLLFTDREELGEAAKMTGFTIEKLHTVSLHGLVVSVYRLVRT
ncbi:MAG: methyltransferase domain-containing protein [Lachnospiraceae bacterium]|nr:methyltransferase domain-containing protein [Lachnospiraceae bacterium]